MGISIYGGNTILPVAGEESGEYILTTGQISKLHAYSIFDWDQLYALFLQDIYRDGLKSILDVDDETLALIQSKAESQTPLKIASELKNPVNLPMQHGAHKPDDGNGITIETLKTENTASNLNSLMKLSKFTTFTETENIELASAVNYVSRLAPPHDQGNRNACVAFAVTAINEYSHSVKTGQYNNLSEQYLFGETKMHDGDNICGTEIWRALAVLANQGQCPETKWSYNPHPPCIQISGKPSNADDAALPYRNGAIPVDHNDIGAIRGHLSIGHLLAFSIPIYNSWYNNPDTINTGRIVMPQPGETPRIGTNGQPLGHAMAMVGYQDAEEWGGGGYFIVRNSFGLTWGARNYYGPGYGVIAYEFIRTLTWELYAM